MRIARALHSWSVLPAEAIAIQRRLASRVRPTGRVRRLRLVAGADLAFSKDKSTCIAGVVVWDVKLQEVVERQVVRRAVRFPYVPGLLSFREAPALIAALRKISCEPDAFMFDGQGYAHPRRFGLACHVGVQLERPSFGCAKSVLTGKYDMPDEAFGSISPLVDGDECVGMAVRTRQRVKPVYVSVGHRLSLSSAVDITLACCTRYRLPEPTRLADQLVGIERQRT